MEVNKYECVKILDINDIKCRLIDREESGYKGTFGTLFCLCGSKGMSGAAAMAILSGLKSGVGMVRAAVSNGIHEILAKKILEAIYFPLKENEEGTISYDSISDIFKAMQKCTGGVIGCGLGRHEDVDKILTQIFKNIKIPIVIDADGINSISRNINIIKDINAKTVITPHIGEMSRLIGVSINEILCNKIKYAKEVSKKYGIVTVLKGADTIISDENGEIFVNRGANSGMAKGGSGDVLAGMIGSFLAQGMDAVDSAICGVYLHSLAGRMCREKFSATSMLPSDIIEQIPEVFLHMNR